MTNTERKLDEARFFLKQLNPHAPYFDYILSAYLNSARSTSWIMRYEFGKVDGWNNWFENSEISDVEKELLKKINDLRITSTKKTGVKTEFVWGDFLRTDEEYYPVLNEMLTAFEGKEIQITILDDDEVPKKIADDRFVIKAMVKMGKDDSKFSRESIYSSCRDYFAFLESQVGICVGKFKGLI